MSCSSATSSEWPYYYYYQQPYDKNEYAISTNPSSLMKSLNDSKSSKKSRDSRNNPATILKADVANFRTLVQQLTGRPSAPSSLRARKGPVNISFAKGNDDNPLDTETSCCKMLPFGFHNYDQQQVVRKKQAKEVISVDQRMHECVSVTSLSSNNTDGQTSMASSSSSEVADPNNMYVDFFDDFDIDQCLEDLDWVTSTNNDGW